MYPLKCKLKARCACLFSLFVFLLSYLSNGLAEPCNSCNIDVSFQGEYLEETCNISINGAGNSETVTLPTLSINGLDHDGAEVGSRQFAISLKGCPSNRVIRVRFISNISSPDPETGNLRNDSGGENSRNVQIRIRKENGSQIKINDADSGQDYDISTSSEEVKHFYTASYYAKGNSAVTPGLVKTTASIDLIYK